MINKLKICDGTLENDGGFVTTDQSIGKVMPTVEELISEVYSNVSNLSEKPYQRLRERAIIFYRNLTMDKINNVILENLDVDSYK